jgi:hypothetical protein
MSLQATGTNGGRYRPDRPQYRRYRPAAPGRVGRQLTSPIRYQPWHGRYRARAVGMAKR